MLRARRRLYCAFVRGSAYESKRITLASASMRVVLGVLGLTVLPVTYPGTAAFRPIFAVYVALACATLLLIHKGVGGKPRAIIGAIIDLALLTFVIHRAGSATNMLVSIYMFACILNVLVVGPSLGLAMAVGASLMYGGVLLAEQLGWLPHAPDAPEWLVIRRTSVSVAVLSWVTMTILTVVSTAIVGRLVKRIADLGERDALTELYNRRHLLAALERELARVRRGRSLAVVMIDLDRFKRVNDQHGHLQGDLVLRRLAEALSRSTRDADVLGRYGGDEFLVVMPDTDEAQARAAAARLVEGVRAVGQEADGGANVTASAGVAVALSDDQARPLLKRADEAAYRAKQEGGDRVVVAA